MGVALRRKDFAGAQSNAIDASVAAARDQAASVCDGLLRRKEKADLRTALAVVELLCCCRLFRSMHGAVRTPGGNAAACTLLARVLPKFRNIRGLH